MSLAKDPAIAKAGGLGVRCTALGPNAKDHATAIEKSSSATIVHADMQAIRSLDIGFLFLAMLLKFNWSLHLIFGVSN